MDDDPSSRLTVRVADPAWYGLIPDVEAHCRRAVDATLALIGPPPGLESAPIDLLLTDDEALRALNAAWRGRDEPTDVLSFPALALDPEAGCGTAAPPGPGLALGDVAVARETAARDAAAEATPIADHLDHLVVHGVLHLLGYDHQRDEDAGRMEDLERQILARLGIADPYRAADER